MNITIPSMGTMRRKLADLCHEAGDTLANVKTPEQRRLDTLQELLKAASRSELDAWVSMIHKAKDAKPA